MTTTIKIVNGDWVIDRRTGRPVTVADGEKLRQDVRENLTIARQPNGFGAGLEDIVGVVEDPFVIRSLIQQRIRESTNTMQRLQDRTQRGQRPANERIQRIEKLDVYPTTIGGGNVKTGFAFSLQVRSEAGTTAIVSGVATA
jgi:hypothetical protein